MRTSSLQHRCHSEQSRRSGQVTSCSKGCTLTRISQSNCLNYPVRKTLPRIGFNLMGTGPGEREKQLKAAIPSTCTRTTNTGHCKVNGRTQTHHIRHKRRVRLGNHSCISQEKLHMAVIYTLCRSQSQQQHSLEGHKLQICSLQICRRAFKSLQNHRQVSLGNQGSGDRQKPVRAPHEMTDEQCDVQRLPPDRL